MTAAARRFADLVGNTPLLALDRFAGALHGRILAKIEYLNPAGSIRTRGAVQIKSLAARRIGDENHGRIDERLLLAVENSSIERTGIRADGNFELAARGIDTERRIQRIDGDIGPI